MGWNTCYGDGGDGYRPSWGDLTDEEIAAYDERHMGVIPLVPMTDEPKPDARYPFTRKCDGCGKWWKSVRPLRTEGFRCYKCSASPQTEKQP